MEKEEKKDKRKIVSLLLLLLLFCFMSGTIYYTYSKFKRSLDGSHAIDVSSFVISINGNDMETSEDFTLTPTIDYNSNVVSGKIAPSSTGHFSIIVDPTGSEVSLDVVVSNLSFSDSVSDKVTITGYSINDSEVKEYNGTIEDVIYLNDEAMTSSDEMEITIYYEWDSDSDDETDTELAGSTIEVFGNVTVSQHI